LRGLSASWLESQLEEQIFQARLKLVAVPWRNSNKAGVALSICSR
jgi:hypothetical protein